MYCLLINFLMKVINWKQKELSEWAADEIGSLIY